MKFLFDLDETLVKGDVIYTASKMLVEEGKLDRLYTSRDARSWNLDGLPPALTERTYQLYRKKEYAVTDKKAIEGVYYFLYYLSCVRSHWVGILTSRYDEVHEDTFEYVFDLFPWISLCQCVEGGPGTEKTEYLEDIDPDYFFDDNIAYCEQARKLGIKTYLVSNEHTPWNHYSIHPDIVRIKNVSFFPRELI